MDCVMKCHFLCLNNIFSMSFDKIEQETAIWQAYMDGRSYPHYNRLTQGEVSEKNKRIDGGFYFDASEK